MENITVNVFNCIIDRAEHVLADYKAFKTTECGFLLVFEGVVVEMYEQRRIEF